MDARRGEGSVVSLVLPPCDADEAEIIDILPALRESTQREIDELQAEANRTFREADDAFGEAEDLLTRAAALRDLGTEKYRTAGALQLRVDELTARLGAQS